MALEWMGVGSEDQDEYRHHASGLRSAGEEPERNIDVYTGLESNYLVNTHRRWGFGDFIITHPQAGHQEW